uniref:N-glycosylase/DNA lyase n=1 Tax=Cacopsylla melanoneura TaxID=428564 RepID=A0A8D8YVX3_9HEMI
MKLNAAVRSLRGKILCPCIELSLTLSLLGGQSFRWKQIAGNRFQGVFKERVWTLWSDPSYLHYEVHSQDNPPLDAATAERILRDYFRLDETLQELYKEWSSKDAFFKKTCGEFVGIRMLNQDLVENLFSFLCSSNNNIARISGMIDKMCTEYGTLIHTLNQDHDTEEGTLQNDAVKSIGDVCKQEPDLKYDVKDEQNEVIGSQIKSSRGSKGTKKVKTEGNGEITNNNECRRTTRGSRKSETATNGKSHVVDVKSDLKSKEIKATGGGRGRNQISVSNDETNKPGSETKSSGQRNTENKNKSPSGTKESDGVVTKENKNKSTSGTKESDGRKFYSFPTVQALAKPAVEAKLRELGFGYRAKFIQKSAEYIEQNGGEAWLETLRGMNYEQARQELQKLPGIGAKVADCICLMSLSHLSSVPVDTHVYQIAVNHYQFNKLATKTLTSAAYDSIRNFFIERFGNYAGWAHSILFCADLKKFQTSSTTEATGDGKGKSKAKGVKRKSSQ